MIYFIQFLVILVIIGLWYFLGVSPVTSVLVIMCLSLIKFIHHVVKRS